MDKVRANEWDDAAGHAIAESAGAIVTSLDNKSFKYLDLFSSDSDFLIKSLPSIDACSLDNLF